MFHTTSSFAAFSRATFWNTSSLILPDSRRSRRKSTRGVGVSGAQISVPKKRRSWNSFRKETA